MPTAHLDYMHVFVELRDVLQMLILQFINRRVSKIKNTNYWEKKLIQEFKSFLDIHAYVIIKNKDKNLPKNS